MEEHTKKKQVVEMRTDIQLLLECLDYQKDDQSAVKQALVTLSSILQSTEMSKEIFRDVNGVQQVLELVTSTSHHQVIEAGLYCLGSAVERNVYSQKLLSTARVFTFLHSILTGRRGSSSLRKKQTATFLVICLVTNNGYGQNLARQSCCLQDIIALIRTSLPRQWSASNDWIEDVEANTVDLWTALVSAACACVNNPINDENQRLCAGLLPFVFNVLTKHADATIVKSALCFVGLTAASNASNQDRVRQCAGLDMLVKKLRTLLSRGADTADNLAVLTQIMATLDACVTDNERNSSKLGELGGIVLVLQLMSESSLPSQDLVQGALLLAHAVEVCNENKRTISEGGGMTVLIQTLTQTDNEELSKTIKYLLHICVASDESEKTDTGDMSNEDSAVQLMLKMEKKKRHNDLEVMRKIRELDNKLNSMEHDPAEEHNQENSDIGFLPEKRGNKAVRSAQMPTSDKSSPDHGTNSTETSLRAELLKEKQARRKLQRLNEMLQEDICSSHSALAQVYSPMSEPQHVLISPRSKDEQTSCQLHPLDTSSNLKETADRGICTQSGQGIRTRSYAQAVNMKGKTPNRVLSPDIDHPLNDDDACMQWKPRQLCLSENNGSLHAAKMVQLRHPERSRVDNSNMVSDGGTANNTYPQSDYLYTASQDNNGTDFAFDLSSKNSDGDSMGRCITKSLAKTAGNGNTPVRNSSADTKTRGVLCEVTTQTTASKNTGIQCGTPFITPETTARHEPVEYTESLVSHRRRQLASLNTQSKCTKTDSFRNQESMSGSVIKDNKHSAEIPDSVVSLCDVREGLCLNKNTNAVTRSAVKTSSVVTDKDKSSQKRSAVGNCNEISTECVQTVVASAIPSKEKNNDQCETSDKLSTCSSEKFRKPVALPPRSKIRVTPLLGSNKLPKPRQFSNNEEKKDNDSDAQSEFDVALLKKSSSAVPSNANNEIAVQGHQDISKPSVSAATKASYVIKSQNDVWRLDRQLESRKHNVADSWFVVPATPRYQTILPVRPAFSDCGTRRKLRESPDSPCSVKSVGKMMHDSGIHSPPDILNLSTSNSPVDSNVDELRSCSDVSDVDDGPLNITREALRSHHMVKFERQDNCPGCQSSFTLKRPLLTSKTYTVELETNPNTCQFHRQIRQCERRQIHQICKTQVQEGKNRRKLINTKIEKKKLSSPEAKKKKKNVFDFSSSSNEDSARYLSNEGSEEVIACRTRSRWRRKRIPYTEEEETNLREGVRKMGKHWNQILVTYKFHYSRTNVDLMEKYKRIRMNESRAESSVKTSSVMTRTHRPFSMCEERRLVRGVGTYGCNWKSILQAFRFTAGRTTEELRNRWRVLQKKKQC